MSDVVVTLPLDFRWGHKRGLEAWCSEGDPAGDVCSGCEYAWALGKARPTIEPGDRVYVVHNRRLIGYAPLIRVERAFEGSYLLIRGGRAVACTIDERIRGFQGFRYRWWGRALERPWPEWRSDGQPLDAEHAESAGVDVYHHTAAARADDTLYEVARDALQKP